MSLDMKDPLWQQKNDLLGQALSRRTYRVMAEISDDGTLKFFSWLRFCEYEGDMMQLMQIKMHDENQNHDSDDQSEQNQTNWRAERLPVLSLANERKVLKTIDRLASEALVKYPCSLQKDEQLLAEDDLKQNLSFNERNCVLFRKGEKEILHFYKDFSQYMLNLMSLKFKEAKKEAQQLPKEFDSAREYIHHAILPLILKEGQK